MDKLQAKLATKVISIFDEDHFKAINIIPSSGVPLAIEVAFLFDIIAKFS